MFARGGTSFARVVSRSLVVSALLSRCRRGGPPAPVLCVRPSHSAPWTNVSPPLQSLPGTVDAAHGKGQRVSPRAGLPRPDAEAKGGEQALVSGQAHTGKAEVGGEAALHLPSCPDVLCSRRGRSGERPWL